MTPEQKLIAKAVFILLLFAGVFFAGFGVRDYMADHEATVVQLEASKALNDGLAKQIDQIAERDTQISKLSEEITALNKASTEALDAKQAENSRLRSDLAVAQRMRFTGAQCPAGPVDAGDPAAGSVGDGAGVELSTQGRLDVFDLRAGIIRTEAQVNYLQGYVPKLLGWIERQRWCGVKPE